MGLDMYLTAERFYWFNEAKPVVGDVPAGYEVQTVTVQAAYWRKANQIHAWFVKNVQDGEDECRPHFVPREKLQELVDLCKEVIADPDLAPEKLPTQSGFFFGDTEYGEYYFADLTETVEQLEKVLGAFGEKEWAFEYRSSW
jgi:hypothetical protein